MHYLPTHALASDPPVPLCVGSTAAAEGEQGRCDIVAWHVHAHVCAEADTDTGSPDWLQTPATPGWARAVSPVHTFPAYLPAAQQQVPAPRVFGGHALG